MSAVGVTVGRREVSFTMVLKAEVKRTADEFEGGSIAASSFNRCSCANNGWTSASPRTAMGLATTSLSSVGRASRISLRIASHSSDVPCFARAKSSSMMMKAAALM